MNKKILLIFATFALVFTLFSISAICCEKTLDGGICQDVSDENQCNSSFSDSPTSCEFTSYCELGTCVDLKQGSCSPNTPSRKCEENEGHWKNKPLSEVPQCQLGGCFLGNDCTFVTNAKCKILSSEYNLPTDFRPNVNTREKCDRLSDPHAVGACVFDEDYQKKCVGLTRRECYEYEGTSGLENVDFYEDYLCTHEDLNTICGWSTETICDEGRVHFVDTCGNIANVYEFEKAEDPDYWNEIIKPEDSCELERNSIGELTNADICGNCDALESSSICKSEQMGVKNEANLGDNVCADLSCKYEGKIYQNGERWCYSNAVEGEQDSPGAEYGLLTCINAEVISEPCDAFRQEVCRENVVDGYSYANCQPNEWKDCTSFDNEDACTNPEYDCQWNPVDWYNPSDHDDALRVKFNQGELATSLEQFITPDITSKEDFL